MLRSPVRRRSLAGSGTSASETVRGKSRRSSYDAPASKGRAATDREPCGADRHPGRAALKATVGDAAGQVGLRPGRDLLATPARLASGRRVAPLASDALGAPARRRTDDSSRASLDGASVPAKKGALPPARTRQIEASRARSATASATRGTPLGFRLIGDNSHDAPQMAPTLDALPALRSGRRDRRRRRLDTLHADKAYDARSRRRECRTCGIRPRIARNDVESSQRLDRHRWVVDPSTSSG